MTKINIIELEKNGYRKFNDQFKRSKDLSESQDPYKGTWQKCIRDEKGKKYFINIQMWDFANSWVSDRNLAREASYQADVQFTLQDETNFNLELLSIQNKTLIEVEQWFEKAWRIHECEYYEKYE